MPERYKVVFIGERLVLTPEGPVKTVIQIRYRTPAGYVGTVEVDKPVATPGIVGHPSIGAEEGLDLKVKAAIEAEVAKIEAIFKLGG